MNNRYSFSKRPRTLGLLAAYGITIIGILFGGAALVSTSKSWFFVVCGLIVVIPLFPTIQALLQGEVPRNLFSFLRTYALEYAALVLQLLFLLITFPLIVVQVVGKLMVALLIAAGITWIIVFLQQLGLQIGRTMPVEDLFLLFVITLALIAAVGLYWLLSRWLRKREEGYFEFWAGWFVRIREIFRA